MSGIEGFVLLRKRYNYFSEKQGRMNGKAEKFTGIEEGI